MATSSLITDAQALKRLPVPNVSVQQMPSAVPNMPVQAPSVLSNVQASQNLQRLPVPDTSSLPPMTSAAPNLPSPVMPTATLDPAIQNTRTRLLGDQAELKRLGDTGSGVSQISNPFLRGLARVGDIAASVIAPGVASAIPGTTNHHNFLINQEAGRVNNDLGDQEKQAQTTLLDAQPALKQLTAENNMLRTQGYLQHVNDQGQHYDDQAEATLRQHGYKHAPDGTVVPLSYDEMSPNDQALHDYRGAQQEAAEATAALKRSQNDPNSYAYRLAKQRVDIAQQNAQTALQRLSISQDTYNARYQGVGPDGRPLAGAMITDDGRPVGSTFSANLRPTGTERNKGDMAASAADQISAMEAIIKRNPTMFGPGYGQSTEFKRWIGSQSPDAQRFAAARTIAGDHLAGTFGGRSEAALTALDNAIGQFKDNPEAALAGLDQLAGANERFRTAGSVRSAGSNANKPSKDAPIGDTTKPDGVYEMNGTHYRVSGGKVYAR